MLAGVADSADVGNRSDPGRSGWNARDSETLTVNVQDVGAVVDSTANDYS